MKHSRITAVSLAAVLTPLAGFAATLAGALPARGGEVPFTEHVISTTAFVATSVFATDVNGDGNIDVLSASWGDSKIAWYESDGETPPTFTERVISTAASGANSVFAADVDGDGDTDVLSALTGNGFLRWYENTGGTPPGFASWVILKDLTGGAKSVFATDVDGDGDIDVLCAFEFANKIAWYENNGAPIIPTFTEHVISTDANLARSVFATDVDGDGDIDVLSASFGPGKIAWYESDGETPPTFTERVISEAAFATSVFATDVDGDGDTDVLSGSWLDGKIAWWESDGETPPTFTELVISTGTNSGDVFVFAADVDGDGDIDVLSASRGDNKIAWYESDGETPPSFTERVISTNAMNATSVFATDLDGDGDIDVLSSSSFDNKIAWYENTLITTPTADFDADDDGDVDLEDFAAFLLAFTGPG